LFLFETLVSEFIISLIPENIEEPVNDLLTSKGEPTVNDLFIIADVQKREPLFLENKEKIDKNLNSQFY